MERLLLKTEKGYEDGNEMRKEGKTGSLPEGNLTENWVIRWRNVKVFKVEKIIHRSKRNNPIVKGR